MLTAIVLGSSYIEIDQKLRGEGVIVEHETAILFGHSFKFLLLLERSVVFGTFSLIVELEDMLTLEPAHYSLVVNIDLYLLGLLFDSLLQTFIFISEQKYLSLKVHNLG